MSSLSTVLPQLIEIPGMWNSLPPATGRVGMGRMAKRADRMPSQRKSRDERVEDMTLSEAKLEAVEWQAYARHVLDRFNSAQAALARAKGVEAADPQRQAGGNALLSLSGVEVIEAKTSRKMPKLEERRSELMERHAAMTVAALQEAEAAAEAKKAEAEAALAAAAEERQRAEQAAAELQAAELARRPVRIKLQGRFFGSVRGGRAAAPPPEPPLAEQLPDGCRLLEGAMFEWEAADAKAQLDELFARKPKDPRVIPITAGQHDLKRLQCKLGLVDADEFPVLKSFVKALADAGETAGRRLHEFNAIRSMPACQKQDRHWDYDPVRVRYDGGRHRRVKPCSAILGLEPGARLYVYDPALKRDVTVLIPVGAILLFEGDVAHAGACYATPNTRVHVYLDVPGVRRETDVTWFEE
jgi:hypothetical protein